MERPGGPHLRGSRQEDHVLQRSLPATPASARLARVTARVACRAWRVPEAGDCAVQVASELVTLTLRHAGHDRVTLRVLMTRRRLRLEVHDPSGRLPRALPRPRGADPSAPDEPAGLGEAAAVDLLDALCVRWGLGRPDAGADVWGEIALVDGRPG